VARIDAAAQAVQARAVPLRDGDAWLVGPLVWQALRDRINTTLDQYHAREPDEPGIERDRLRRIAHPTLDRDCYSALIEEGLSSGELAVTGNWLHRAAHRIKLSPQEERFRDKVVPRIAGAGLDPPWMRDLAKLVALDERTTRLYLRRLQRAGALHQVVPDLYFAQSTIDRLIAACRELEQRNRAIRAADLRDALGLGRKRVIQILEYFDRAGITRRVADDRWLRQR
jgi:selenocysteine-specific elongation factor